MTKALPRGIRNNNPGNVERGSDRWLGMSADQSADGRFLVFDTPDAGIRCLMRLLINYQERHGIRTLREAINRWAPPGENNSTAYVQHVSRLTGFDPDEPLDFLDREINVALTRAIVRHENGEPTVYGRKEWYPADVFERAAVMAGFEPTTKPLAKSRTVAGAVIAAAGAAGRNAGERAADRAQGMAVGREEAHTEDGGEFFAQLAAHWKKNYSGWTAWMLTPDLKLPSKMRLKESRRVPMWNGPIECRMFRFDMIKGAVRDRAAKAAPDGGPRHEG